MKSLIDDEAIGAPASPQVSRVRVAHLTTVHQPFDVRIFKKQCCSLARSGYHVTLVCSGAESGLVDGVHIESIGPRAKSRQARMTLSSWRAFQAARRSGASIIHFHDPELIPVGLALKALGRRVIYDVHEDVPLQIRQKMWIAPFARRAVARLMAALENYSGRTLDRVSAATPKIESHFPHKKAVTIQNFPIIGELETPDEVAYHSRPRNVIYVGGLLSERGVAQMVLATRSLASSKASFHKLHLAGQFVPATLQDELEIRNDQHDAVHYHGVLKRSGVRELFAASRAGLVTLLPTPRFLESYPVKLFEYWSAGLPIIASDFPLWRQIVGDVGGGLLVDPTNPAAIAKAISWIMENEDEAAEMGARGRKAVLERYNWAAEEKKLLAMYAEIESEISK